MSAETQLKLIKENQFCIHDINFDMDFYHTDDWAEINRVLKLELRNNPNFYIKEVRK